MSNVNIRLNMKTRILTVFILIVFVFMFSSCHENAVDGDDIIAPINTPIQEQPTSTPVPTVSPAPSISAPPPTENYSVRDFFSTDNIFIQYNLKLQDAKQDSYVEYTSESTNKIQRRILSTVSDPFIEVTQCDGNALLLMYVRQNVGYTYNFLDYKDTVPEILLQEPIITGNSWAVPGGTSKISSVDKSISVPMGVLNAIEITTDYSNGETRIQYYARDIGLVSEFKYDKGSNLYYSREAEFRESDRSFNQRIRLYYADPQTNKILYINQDLPLSPNTSMEKMFASKLKAAPSPNLLSLSSSVVVNAITISKNNSLTVDFSKHIVTQTQVLRQNEVAFLQALADTFGSYYQAKRVYITIDKKTYESKNMFLLSGESIEPKPKNAVLYDPKKY